MSPRSRFHRLLPAGFLAVAVAGVLGAPGTADAAVEFDRAFGLRVVQGSSGEFENCTTASGCQTGHLSGDAGVGQPAAVAVDAQGRIVVADLGFHRIGAFPVAGDGTVGLDRVFGIDVDVNDGTSGDFENCAGTVGCEAGSPSGAAGGMSEPAGVAVDPQGRILVGGNNNNRVDRFAVAGDGTVTFDRAFGIDVDPSDGNTGDFENCTSVTGCQAGTASGAPGGMDNPAGVAVDAQGGILVADQSNHRVDRFTVAGDGTVSFDRAFGHDVASLGGGFQNCTVATGCLAGGTSGASGGMNGPFGITVDGQGRILVADRSNHRIDRFTVGGGGTVAFDRAFGIDVAPGGVVGFENCTAGTGCQVGAASGAAGGMNTPGGVAVDAQGRIVVGDQSNHRIDRFTVAADGTVSFDLAFGVGVDTGTGAFDNCTAGSGCQTGTASGAAGGMNTPVGLAFDAQGRLLVADFNNLRVDRFLPERTVTVTKVLAPASDPGSFDLLVDGVVVRAAARNGQSGSRLVDPGDDVTISEQAVSGRLSDYDTTIDCGAGPQPGPSLTLTNVTANVSCTIRNARKPAPRGPGASAIDAIRPRLASASLTNRTFAVNPRGAAETPVSARVKRGTVFRYRLSEAARVVFTIERATRGRRVGRACRRRTRSNRKRRRCTRYVRAGRFAKRSPAGANRHPFSGRIGRRSLKPGRYRLTLVATDAAGNRSARRRLSFSVVKRKVARRR